MAVVGATDMGTDRFAGLEFLAFAGPLLILPALIIAQLIVQSPVLRREPVTSRHRRVASVLAIVALVATTPLLLIVWALGVFGFMLLAGLVVPAGLTLTRLRAAALTPATDWSTPWDLTRSSARPRSRCRLVRSSV